MNNKGFRQVGIRPLAGGPVPGGRAAEFAAALIARHAPGSALEVPAVERTLRPWAARRIIERRMLPVSLSSRLEIHLPLQLLQLQRGSVEQILAQEVLPVRTILRTTTLERMLETISERLQRRLVRVETGGPSLPGQPAGAQVEGQPGGVVGQKPAIVYLNRPAPAPAADPPRPEAAPDFGPGIRLAGSRLEGFAAANPAPPLDINRLTEQVVQVIDQRIIAQQERLGRSGL